MENDRSMTFVLPGARWEQLAALARREGRSVSGQLRYALERYLDGAAGHDLRQMADERVKRLMGGRDKGS